MPAIANKYRGAETPKRRLTVIIVIVGPCDTRYSIPSETTSFASFMFLCRRLMMMEVWGKLSDVMSACSFFILRAVITKVIT